MDCSYNISFYITSSVVLFVFVCRLSVVAASPHVSLYFFFFLDLVDHSFSDFSTCVSDSECAVELGAGGETLCGEHVLMSTAVQCPAIRPIRLTHKHTGC